MHSQDPIFASKSCCLSLQQVADNEHPSIGWHNRRIVSQVSALRRSSRNTAQLPVVDNASIVLSP